MFVNRRKTLAILDTGAAVSCLSANFVRKNKIRVIKNGQRHPLYTADGRTLRIIGYSSVCISLDDYKVQHDFYVVEKLNHSAIFGIDFFTDDWLSDRPL